MVTIEGSQGTWELEVSASSVAGDKLRIRFTPKKGVTCKNIRLVQTCKPEAFGKDGQPVAGPPEAWYRDPDPPLYRPTKPDRVKEDDGAVRYVDHNNCDKEPWLAEDDKDKMTGGATQAVDFPYVIFDKVIRDGISKIVKHFVTAAICVDTGEVLGCVAWKSTSTPTEEGKIAIDPADKEVAFDEGFRKALRKFARNHTAQKSTEDAPRWLCPDKSDLPDPPTPWGDPVPEGIRKKWLASESPSLRIGMGEKIGHGARFASGAQALAAAREAPGRAALKFTWAGGQERVVPGVVFAAAALAPSDIAPHVEEDRRFVNDFAALRLCTIEATGLQRLLEAVGSARPSTGEPPESAAVTVIAGIGREAASFTLALDRPAVSAFAVRAAEREEDEDVRRALNHLSLNMGSGRVGRFSP
jgi:hypothetical protein